jgi:glycosyltransferase involved in cell wall biosynthesis
MEVASSPAPLRVLYFIPIAWWGGSQRYVFDLAHAAQAAGHEVVVVTGEGELPERLREASIPVITRSVFSRGINASTEHSFFSEILRITQDFKPDIIHSNNSKGGLMGTLAGRLAGVRHVYFTAHGWAFTEARPLWQRVIFWLAQYVTVVLTDRIICVSQNVYEHARRMPFMKSKLALIPNGIDDIELLPRHEARMHLAPTFTADRWIGSIAELHPNKDVPTLVRAFALIAKRYPDTVLAIIGEGEERARIEPLIASLGLTDRVALCGHVPHAARYLSAFDIFVLPSRTEALGYALLEAGMAGLAAIGSDVGGIPEILQPDKTGLLFPVGNAPALSEALSSYLNDPGLRENMGKALRAHVEANFSKKEMLRKTLALY